MYSLVKLNIIPAALSMLPSQMDSPAARAMLLATCMQESGLRGRRQYPSGPARGLWQFEEGSLIALKSNHRTREYVNDVLISMLYKEPLDISDLLRILEHNDILQCALARLLYWALPTQLPQPGDYDYSWGQYLAAWNPGEPRHSTWHNHYNRAWMEITGEG